MIVDKSPWPSTTGSRVRLAQLWDAFEPDRRHLVVLGTPDPQESSALDAATSGRYSVSSGSAASDFYTGLRVQAEAADVVWASGPPAAAALGDLRRPLIVDVPSLNRQLLVNELAVHLRRLPSPSDAKRLISTVHGAPERLRSEKRAWKEARMVTPCSPYEQGRLPRQVRERSALVPNGCDLRPLPTASPIIPRLIFVGTLHYPPNAEAVLLLAERILPSIRRLVPGLELDVLGSFPATVGARLSSLDGVAVHGFVDDLATLYRRATHTIIPLLRSTGTNVKVLEAIAHGVPVIATPAALTGLPALVPDRDVVLAPDWRQCGRLLLELLSNPQRSRDLATSAWRTAYENYTWDRSREALRRVVMQLTAPGGH